MWLELRKMHYEEMGLTYINKIQHSVLCKKLGAAHWHPIVIQKKKKSRAVSTIEIQCHGDRLGSGHMWLEALRKTFQNDGAFENLVQWLSG